MKDILVINDFGNYGTPFESLGKVYNSGSSDEERFAEDPDSFGLVVLTGGEDVWPGIYGKKPNPKTSFNRRRDEYEQRLLRLAVSAKIPIAGICRGAQFICANAGGILAQHVNNHGQDHNVRTNDGRIFSVTSSHHQMQIPPSDALVLAWAEPKRSSVYEGSQGENLLPEKEYEVVYYPSINALGFQYHPEWMNKDSQGFKYVVEMVKKHLLNEV